MTADRRYKRSQSAKSASGPKRPASPKRHSSSARPRPDSRDTSARPNQPLPASQHSSHGFDTEDVFEGEEWEARFIDLADPDHGDEELEAAAPDQPKQARDIPLIAIVGRPNVGKSRLFNRMTGTRFAIVEDEPGVTRDRQYGKGRWYDRVFSVVDTGGFEPEASDILLQQMKEQAVVAMLEADIILFVVDAQAGLMPSDTEIASLLRATPKPVFLVVNKIDGPSHEALTSDFYSLGLPELYGISAEHGRDYEDLMDGLMHLLPKESEVQRDEADDQIRVAVIGKPNVGKSTLVNQLLGEERLLTADMPGTTRDSINTELTRDGQRYLLIDTAGVRRKRGISHTVEKYSVVQAFKSIDRADVVMLMLDATEKVTSQDQRLAGLIHDKGRALLILLNKWDLVEKDHRTADKFITELRDELKFSKYAPVVTISAKTGQRVHRLLGYAQEVNTEFRRRVPTGQLNRVLRDAIERNPPPSKGRRRLRLFYASQVATGPPTFMLAINHKDLVHFSYDRYIQNVLRREFAFEGTPIKVFYRERSQREREDE